MAVTLPTVDDFTETTVLTMIRKVVDYLCSDSGLVAQINNNDITGFTSSYTNNLLKIDATKGDGTTIPVCSLTIQGGSSTGNPYPTGISGNVGADGNITFTVTMSSGSPLTTTINMTYFASADDLSDLQEQVTGLKLTSSGNNMSINGTTAPIVNSISGSVSNGNLKISVNGVESVDIPLPNKILEYDPVITNERLVVSSPISHLGSNVVRFSRLGGSYNICSTTNADEKTIIPINTAGPQRYYQQDITTHSTYTTNANGIANITELVNAKCQSLISELGISEIWFTLSDMGQYLYPVINNQFLGHFVSGELTMPTAIYKYSDAAQAVSLSIFIIGFN